MARFICKKHNKEFLAYGFSIIYKNDKIIYRDHNKNTLRCPGCDCSTPDIESINEETEYSTINIGRFSSMSTDQKREYLRQRSAIRKSEDEERRQHLNRNFKGTLTDKDI